MGATLFVSSKYSATNAAGLPLAGGKVYTYAAGSLTPLATFTNQSGASPNTNPVILDATGRASIWLGPYPYRFRVYDANNVLMPDGDVDNITSPSSIVTLTQPTTDLMTGNGVTTTYTLSANPANVNNVFFSLGGAIQVPGVDYTLNGVVITTTSPPPNGVAGFFNYTVALPVATIDAASTVFKQFGGGAVSRTAESKLRESVSVKDYSLTLVSGGDATAALTAAIAAFNNVVIDLGNDAYTITDVQIPPGKAITIRNGTLTVTGVGKGIQRVTTVSPQSGGTFAKYSFILDNVQFIRSVTGGACVYVNLAWQDSTGGVVVNPNCSFTLTNGAVGVRLGRGFFSTIGGKFTMDGGGVGTSTGLLCDASEVVAGDTYPACPFVATITANFTGGIGFDQVFVTASQWNSFEGFTFAPGAQFYASQFKAKKYNLLKCTGVEWNSSKCLFDSGFNTILSGGYVDRNVVGDGPLITFKTTLRTSTQVYIGGGFQCNAQGSVGDLILFTDTDSAVAAQISNVVIDAVSFVGGLNDAANQINGIKCDHAQLRNVNFTGAATFQNLYACWYFTKGVNRSLISQFDARDISFYAFGVVTGYGVTQYNRFDSLYRVIPVSLDCANYTTSISDEVIASQILSFPSFQRPPLASVTSVTTPFGAGFFDITAAQVSRDAVKVNLVKKTAATTSTRGGASGVLTLDASAYLAPL